MIDVEGLQSTISRDVAKSGLGAANEGALGAYQAFDAFFLHLAIEQSLPKHATSVFGAGFSGDVLRSQLAEHIAQEILKRSDFSLLPRVPVQGYQKL